MQAHLIQAVDCGVLDDGLVELAQGRHFHLLDELIREAGDSRLQGWCRVRLQLRLTNETRCP